jgi:G3E family GTPase
VSVSVEAIAEILGLKKEELIKNSIKAYLESELRRVNAEINILYMRYGITSLKELDEKINEEELSETETFEDFTRLDYLEARKEKIEQLLKVLT